MAKHRHTPQEEDADEITHFGVSMASHLLEPFDALIEMQGYTNRSEAIRDLVRDRLGEEVRKLANRLLSLKGVKHGRLLTTGTAEEAG